MKPLIWKLFIRIISYRIIFVFVAIFISLSTLHAQVQTGSFEFEGLIRDYLVFLPQNFQPNMPVVFVLHGATEDAEYIQMYTGMDNVADTAGFIAVYPNGVGGILMMVLFILLVQMRMMLDLFQP